MQGVKMKAVVRSLLVTAFFCGAFAANATSVLYSNLPSPQPWNLPSQAYEATSTYEFGGLISFAGPNYSIDGATVAMSNWALKSDWDKTGDSTGYHVPLTLNLYGVGAGNTVGALLASDTVDAFIPWRPEATGCDNANGYDPGDGGCYHGFLAPVSFTFDNVIVPQQVIFGLAFNTTDYGPNPTHVQGPYDSLNMALSPATPSIGSNPFPDTAYVNSVWGGFYSDKGVGGTGTFRQDTGWTADGAGVIQLTGTPEPTTCLLLGGGLIALSLIRRRRRA
jgi:hypothetical protein